MTSAAGRARRSHCATIMRRSAAIRAFGSTLFALTWFKGCLEIENVHPVEGGVLRMKSRRDRRPSLPMEPVWKFYPTVAFEMLVKHVRVAKAAWGIFRTYRKVAKAKAVPYSDQAMQPVSDDDVATLELFTHNQSARDAVEHARKVKELTGAA